MVVWHAWRMGRLNADDWARAALAALAEGGLAAVAVEPVAVRLGVSKGSFYWHFANRRALVEAALRRWESQTEQIIADLAQVADPAERVRTLMELALGDSQDAAISFWLISEAADPLAAEVARRVTERRLDFMRATLVEAGVPEPEARRRVLSGYASYLGLAALRRVGATSDEPDLAASATAELLGTRAGQ